MRTLIDSLRRSPETPDNNAVNRSWLTFRIFNVGLECACGPVAPGMSGRLVFFGNLSSAKLAVTFAVGCFEIGRLARAGADAPAGPRWLCITILGIARQSAIMRGRTRFMERKQKCR